LKNGTSSPAPEGGRRGGKRGRGRNGPAGGRSDGENASKFAVLAMIVPITLFLAAVIGGQAVESGTCNASDIEAAKRHVQTVSAPSVVQTGLEVILQDSGGVEIWRGPYL